jgi:hypothetical protein
VAPGTPFVPAEQAWHAICNGSARIKLSEGGMLWTFFVSLLFLWCVGLATSFTLSGFIHLLPIMAGVVALVGTIQRRQLI